MTEVDEERLREAIRVAWTISGKMLRVNSTGPVAVIEEVGLHEFTNLVLTYMGSLAGQRR